MKNWIKFILQSSLAILIGSMIGVGLFYFVFLKQDKQSVKVDTVVKVDSSIIIYKEKIMFYCDSLEEGE